MIEPTIHATCVALDGKGLLLRGPSAAGKSDLALRLIEAGATLVADDRVILRAADGRVTASPPKNLAGYIEVRGVGVVEMAHIAVCTVALVVDLVGPDHIDRLPEPREEELEGIRIAHLRLDPFEISAPAKVKLALDVAVKKRRLKQ